MRHSTLSRLSLVRNFRFFSSAGTAAAMLLSLTFAASGIVVEFLKFDENFKNSLDVILAFLTIMALIAAVYLEFKRAVDHILSVSHGGFDNRFIMVSHNSFEELRHRLNRAINITNTFIEHRKAVPGGTSNPYTFHS